MKADNSVSVKELVSYTEDILKLKYDLRRWTAMKIASLVTMNSILLGSLLLLAKEWPPSMFVDRNFALAAVLIFGLSLGCCLMAIVARKSTPRTLAYSTLMHQNIRTSTGTEELTPDQLAHKLKELSWDDLLKTNLDLMQRINALVSRDQRYIQSGVFLTFAGLMMLLIGLAFLVIERTS